RPTRRACRPRCGRRGDSAWRRAPRRGDPGVRGRRAERLDRVRACRPRIGYHAPRMAIRVAILGSGNIGTDLMIKILRHGEELEMAALVGVDPASDGLARARRMGVATTHDGLDGLMAMPDFADIDLV